MLFEENDLGEFQFGLVRGSMDCRIEPCEDAERLEFTWDGENEIDPLSGRGRAIINEEDNSQRDPLSTTAMIQGSLLKDIHEPRDHRRPLYDVYLSCRMLRRHYSAAVAACFLVLLTVFLATLACSSFACKALGVSSQGLMAWAISRLLAVVSLADKGCVLGIPYFTRYDRESKSCCERCRIDNCLND
jgi:hypothetical protein